MIVHGVLVGSHNFLRLKHELNCLLTSYEMLMKRDKMLFQMVAVIAIVGTVSHTVFP